MDVRLMYLSLWWPLLHVRVHTSLLSSSHYGLDGKQQPSPGQRTNPPEFNTCSLCHFLSASHDIGNYSALVWMEPGRRGVLLPCSWVSHSNRSKLAVTEAGLGSCCYASETVLCNRVLCSPASQCKATSHYTWERQRSTIWLGVKRLPLSDDGLPAIGLYIQHHSSEDVAA